MTKKVLYLLLTILFILFWFYLVDFKEVAEVIAGIRWPFLIVAAALSLIPPLPAALRLKILFSRVCRLPIKFIWMVGYIASLASLSIPFYIGGFGAAYILARKAKTSYTKSFAILFVDFSFGVMLTFILGILGTVYFYQKRLLSLKLGNLGVPLILFFAALVLMALFLILKSRYKTISNFFLRLKKSLTIFTPKIVFLAFLLTLTVFVLGVGSSYLYFLAFGLSPKVADFVLATSLFGLLGLIPGAPGKIGQYETFGVLTLPLLLNLDKNAVFAVLVVSHALSIVTTTILGIFSMYYLKIDQEVKTNISKVVKRGLRWL